ncbi:hypothetical protein TrVE_jg13005 [Triparma verrucosa]|uniref:Uncharacterized protein n=1 Tax=Triparma verrucosa TaxID=1606542 RepID=A0A9W7B0H3_9STRA|nr:hypothetical protein TrVE_jg13005 [Triparma verrucosa]
MPRGKQDDEVVAEEPYIKVSLYGKPSTASKILLHSGLTPAELSSCISQLFSSDLSKNGIDSVHGLYDTRGLFKPLSYFISNLDTSGDDDSESPTLSILPSSAAPKAPKKKKGTFDDPYVLVGASLAFVLAFAVGLIEALMGWIVAVPVRLFDVIIETPVKQLYRNGPSLFGWEGLSYPEICARITYHGDQVFWSKNLVECKKIFYAKEAAVLLIAKPTMYCGIFAIVISIAHSFVKASAKSKPDPDMVATFKAIKTLSKQMTKK